MLISLDGRRVHYDLVGPAAGPVVCLLHALSADGGVWVEQVPALLAQGWRVLRLDMRGHGGSAPGPAGVIMSDLAGDVAAALDVLGLDRVHLVGLSIGGMIGQTFALEHGERLQSLLLTGTSPQAVPGGQAMWDARFAAIHAAGSVEPLADATMGRWFTDAFRPRRPDRWRQVRDTIAATTPDGYEAGARAIIAFDVQARLPDIRVPTLVLCGDEDTGTPPEGNRRIADLIPGARYLELAHARHIPMIEHPDLFNRLLVEWVTARA